ncbi:hypothetical protein Acor_74680 [Acrocarpospora corrugata]|uniref:Uncharacterized protein n=1 Tax=Acrocarpospora corrugata TaxID=35763 RepID=A0A5M3WAY4_9ACTN|nr:hypothetical protein [Acrocarpospora corrugata]GES05400.1 hypothetical protein Acor_74680 [Acrocarpospora corrugata]
MLLESAQHNGDGSVTLTFSFDLGCEGAPTEALVVRMPAGSSVLSAGQPGGWRSVVKGNAVEWTGPGIADGTKASMTAGPERIASLTIHRRDRVGGVLHEYSHGA